MEQNSSGGGEIRCGGTPECLGKEQFRYVHICACVYSLPKGPFTFVVLVKAYCVGFQQFYPITHGLNPSQHRLSLSNCQSHAILVSPLVSNELLHCELGKKITRL